MYECPNCSANLKYNISKQALFCEHCETTMDPYSFHKESDAEESLSFGVTVFTCPQCGGELMTDDTTAATFCSFCGSSTILDSRVSKEKCPDYIIPFSLDEEACKKSYKKMMRRAIFAPKELSDPEQIKKFRGIYMPYWVYSLSRKGTTTFDAERSSRRGDYIHTKHYDLECDLDMEYNGIAYDASSSFYDSLSNAIAPFHTNTAKPFHPSYLSGFYADTSDVEGNLYTDDAYNVAWEDAINRIHKKSVFFSYKKPTDTSLKRALPFLETSQRLALFPVWFLSYKKDDRVTYAVINGQNGRAAADLPVDKKKYILGSGLLTIPIFILLNILFTIKPTTLLWLSILLAFICIIMANGHLTNIKERETLSNDKGFMSKEEGFLLPPAEHHSKTSVFSILKPVLSIVLYVTIPMLVMLWWAGALSIENIATVLPYLGILCLPVLPLVIIVPLIQSKTTSRKKKPRIPIKEKLPFMKYPLISILLAIVILIWNPVHNLFYYIGVIVCMIMLAMTFTDLIELHNRFTTRKLPQLNKRGGDEYV